LLIIVQDKMKLLQPAGRSGLAVACLTAVREVLQGSSRAVGKIVFIVKTTVIYSLGHGLCALFL